MCVPILRRAHRLKPVPPEGDASVDPTNHRNGMGEFGVWPHERRWVGGSAFAKATADGDALAKG
jgi:hypothetical protein